MKAKEEVMNDLNAQSEDLFEFAGLGLTGQQLDEVTGGSGGWGCTTCDYSNHNETTVSDREDEVRLIDLPVAEEQAEEVIGGTLGRQADEFGSTFTDGVFTRAE